MGREATGHITYLGQSGTAKLLLESQELIVRGAVKTRIPRADILEYGSQDEVLWIETTQGRLVADLGAKVAALWPQALAKAPPSLGEKLGVSATKRVLLLTEARDPDLQSALVGSTAQTMSNAVMTLAELYAPNELAAILPRLGHLPFWGITRKGKNSVFNDDALRATLRAQGWVDTKSCSVSTTMTGTRYHRHTP